MRAALILLALAVAGCASPSLGPALPDDVTVLGDSISRAANLGPDQDGDRPRQSWATGSDPADRVESHLERLRALKPDGDVVGFNNARSGARVIELREQAEEAVRQGASYVLVLFGANDACDFTHEGMTSEADFRARVRSGLEPLAALAPGSTVMLVSVPDVSQLVETFADNETVRAMWAATGMCRTALGPDGDPAAVRARIEAYNRVLEAEALARGYAWDAGRVFAMRYHPEDVSELDYFHPSEVGQARLAEATWDAGPWAR